MSATSAPRKAALSKACKTHPATASAIGQAVLPSCFLCGARVRNGSKIPSLWPAAVRPKCTRLRTLFTAGENGDFVPEAAF